MIIASLALLFMAYLERINRALFMLRRIYFEAFSIQLRLKNEWLRAEKNEFQ